MFTLPERQLAALREALQAGPVTVSAQPNDGNPSPVSGKITFVDNTVDPQYGSIRVKAMFPNDEHRLWPGTYANVNATVQVLNVIRVVTLFYLGQWNEHAFEWAHLYVWQALIMLDVLIVWVIWVKMAQSDTAPGSPRAAAA